MTMIEVIGISAAAGEVFATVAPPSYYDMASFIGTQLFQIRILDGGDSIMCPEDIEDSTGTFEMDNCIFYAPALIFRQGEYSVPEPPRMSIDEARRRISHFRAGWDDYERKGNTEVL